MIRVLQRMVRTRAMRLLRYVQRFLSDYHSYLLWVKKDKARWERMERRVQGFLEVCILQALVLQLLPWCRSMFDDSGLKGFSLGDDGHCPRKLWRF